MEQETQQELTANPEVFNNPERQEKEKPSDDIYSLQSQVQSIDLEIEKIISGIKIDSEEIEKIRSDFGLEKSIITWPAQAGSIERIEYLKSQRNLISERMSSFQNGNLAPKELKDTYQKNLGQERKGDEVEPSASAQPETLEIEKDRSLEKKENNDFMENFIKDLEQDISEMVLAFKERMPEGLDNILTMEDLNNLSMLVNFMVLLKTKTEQEGRLDLRIVSDLFGAINGILPNIVLKINQTPVAKDSISNLQSIKNTINNLSTKTKLAKMGISMLAAEELSDDLKNSGPDPVSELENKLPQTIQLLENLSAGLDYRINLVNKK